VLPAIAKALLKNVKMKKLFFGLFSVLIFIFMSSCKKTITKQPNIVIILTDDMGYADVSYQSVRDEVHTPNIDALARSGVYMSAGYVTAPQCVPSRAGLMTGIYQQKFGLESNHDKPPPLGIPTIAELIQKQGYTTGMVGKWHLEPNAFFQHAWLKKQLPNIKIDGRRAIVPADFSNPYQPWNRGFDQVFEGILNYNIRANYNINGEIFNQIKHNNYEGTYRIDLKTQAATTFINQSHQKPFFLYVSYYAPHTHLEAPQKYLSRIPHNLPNRRRYALAMNVAIDDGVGAIMQSLKNNNILQNTVIFFMSDNGAPYKLEKKDAPLNIDVHKWNGSLNDPWVGEKDLLTEGGIRVPFIISWEGTLMANQHYSKPVSSLDAVATALTLSGGDAQKLDGVNLIPFLNKTKNETPHQYLFWRFKYQEAVRGEQYKYIRLSDNSEFLFDMYDDLHEHNNIIVKHPQIAEKMAEALDEWSKNLEKPREEGKVPEWPNSWINYYLRKR